MTLFFYVPTLITGLPEKPGKVKKKCKKVQNFEIYSQFS